MFLVNVGSMHVLPRIVDSELIQSKLNLDFIKCANDLLDTCGRSTILTSLSILELSIGVAAAVSSSGFSAKTAGRTGTRLVESTQPLSLPVSLSSFGWDEWHLCGSFTVRVIKSCSFPRFSFLLSPHVAGHFESLPNFFYKDLHNSHKYYSFSILFN
jgi:hypothetical protein